MAITRVTEKSLRRINRRTGVEFVKAGTMSRVGGGGDFEAVDADDVHWVVNRNTWTAKRIPEHETVHWASCGSAP